MRWQSCGPSTIRFRWLLPWDRRVYLRRAGSISLAYQEYRPTPLPSGTAISTDRGVTWHTVGVGLREPIVPLDRAQFKDGEELQVRVLATNGLSNAIVTSEPFRV